MYRRLIILSLIIVAALCGLSWLGYRAVTMWIQGIEGTRITEFANVAEQIRLDVKNKLDEFMEQEQNRPYTHYQYYTVPEQSAYVFQANPEGVQGVPADEYFRQRLEVLNEPAAINSVTQQQIPLMLSPLAGNLENGLAYFNFQYDPVNNNITTPNYKFEQQQSGSLTQADIDFNNEVGMNSYNVRNNLVPVLNKLDAVSVEESSGRKVTEKPNSELDISKLYETKDREEVKKELSLGEEVNKSKTAQMTKSVGNKTSSANRTGSYNIESFQNTDGKAQVQTQSRNFIMSNAGQNELADAVQQPPAIAMNQQAAEQQIQVMDEDEARLQHNANIPAQEKELQERIVADEQQINARGGRGGMRAYESEGLGRGGLGGRQVQVPQSSGISAQADARNDLTASSTTTGRESESQRRAFNMPQASEPAAQREANQQIAVNSNQSDMVEVLIEGFTPIVVKGENDRESIFGGQVFMVRKVKYEGRELIQGFQLNEKKLLEEVEESTKRFVREGMSYELGRKQNEISAYTAILDFVGLGHLLLNLFENDPGRIVTQISHLRTWYYSIVSVVFLAVTLAVGSLWLNARTQLKLAQKKDDFVSAVSHELRTPLTSIRMHAEMLEKNWIKSENKLSEYYKSIRQESERLSRLIENVLDFSRIKKGHKKFLFKLGDINKCVEDVVEMMQAYAVQRGFQVKTQLGECREIAFDSDAVTQIVVNLLDNAVKYSSNSDDKTITIRTKCDEEFVLIEVEDHGPGIPHRQRKKVFQEFYRIGSESTRETAGSGLGLALVKKFAQAHNGFVEIISARPTGSIFRVSLAVKVPDSI